MIKAPFNFVPLADKVFFPKDADKISQDLPFSNGIDGYIKVKFTAKTPIFVRNGHSKAEGESKTGDYASSAITPDGHYYLPATTVKGAIRNVLEVLSFGKMRVDKNAMFAEREWNNPQLYTFIKNPAEQKRLCCGWLICRDGKYYIRKCEGNPYRINHMRLDECLKTDVFKKHFSKNCGMDLNREQMLNGKQYDPKTAVYKYRLLESIGIDRNQLKLFRFSQDPEFAVKYKEERYCADPKGDIAGTIVLTGQPDLAKWPINGYQRQMGDGKFYEFIFSNQIEKEIELAEGVFEHFRFIYQDSDDWEYCKTLLAGDGIPVFFRMSGEKLRDFGLAFLYKLPYDYSPYELEKKGNRYKDHNPEDLDLAESIFGYTQGREALRGRVQFSNFLSEDADPDKEYTLVLNSPKASYYPIYIQQDGNNGVTARYLTYNDGRLAGWKRYHVRNTVWENSTGDSKIDTTIYPLKAGSTFHGRISFHNLRPAELGALLSALTFHGDEANCYHQMGQAKPYGFGKLALEITDMHLEPEDPGFGQFGRDYYLALFEKAITEVFHSWYCSEQITQLFTLAHQEVTDEDVFKYMKLDMDGNNEFEASKKAFEFMRGYTSLCHKTYSAQSKMQITETAGKIKEELVAKIEKIKELKSRFKKYVKAEFLKDAEELKANEILPLLEELKADKNYQLYMDEIDPKDDSGYRMSDDGDLKMELKVPETIGTLEELIGKPSSPEVVFNKVKKWGNPLTDDDIKTICLKLNESFVAKKMKPKEIEQWKDEKNFDKKFASLIKIEFIGRDTAHKVFENL